MMSNKHRRTFLAIFEKPDRADIAWDDFLHLLVYLGAVVRSRGGSAHGFRLNGVYAVFHKPHPGHTLYPSELKRVRIFLTTAGIEHVE